MGCARRRRSPQALGSFTVTALYTYRVALRHPADPYGSLALSDERAGTLPAKPSKPLALGTLTR